MYVHLKIFAEIKDQSESGPESMAGLSPPRPTLPTADASLLAFLYLGIIF